MAVGMALDKGKVVRLRTERFQEEDLNRLLVRLLIQCENELIEEVCAEGLQPKQAAQMVSSIRAHLAVADTPLYRGAVPGRSELLFKLFSSIDCCEIMAQLDADPRLESRAYLKCLMSISDRACVAIG